MWLLDQIPMFTWILNKSETGPEYKRLRPSDPVEWNYFMDLMCKVGYIPKAALHLMK